MRIAIHLVMAFVLALTCWPTESFAQANNWMLRQQQMQQQQRMLDQQRRQQEMQRQQREQQRRQQEAQRRQMEEQRRRQQAAMQQRQREMQVRQQQMQAQRLKIAEERRLQQQRRQQEMQRNRVQRQQVVTQQARQTARIARDTALRTQRERRLTELRQRTRLKQQQEQRQRADRQVATMALLSRGANRAAAINTQGFAQRRQDASQRFSQLRASRPAAAAGAAGSGGAGNTKGVIVANAQFKQQKLQEFRNRQALKGAKETKQDVATRPKALPGPRLEDLKDRRVINSFAGRTYQNRQLNQDTRMYKYHGVDNRTGAQVTWLTNKKYSNEAELRKELAIRKDWGVKITHVSQFKVPKGTWVSEGKAASQGKDYPGGGYQAVVQNVPRAWLERTDKAFK